MVSCLGVRKWSTIRRDVRAVEGTGLENRRGASLRGFESHSLRQLHIDLRKYPSGRRGSPAKGVDCLKNGARVQIPPSAPGNALSWTGRFLFCIWKTARGQNRSRRIRLRLRFCPSYPRFRWAELGMPISPRYLATVRREALMPRFPRASRRASSERGEAGSSAAMKRRMCSCTV